MRQRSRADVAEKSTLDIPMYVDILSNFCSNKIASKLKLVNPKPKGKFCLTSVVKNILHSFYEFLLIALLQQTRKTTDQQAVKRDLIKTTLSYNGDLLLSWKSEFETGASRLF